MATVLITDGEERSALAAARSLGHAGHVVHVCSRSGRSLTSVSRFVKSDHAVPDPLGDSESYAEAVARLATDLELDVLLPVSEESLLAILPRREWFAGVVIPFGEAESFCALSDKLRVWEEARQVGLEVPRQRVLHNRTERVTGPFEWPVVVKPARSVADETTRRRKHPVRHASGPRELEAVLHGVGSSAYPVLLQERIRGSGVGIFLLRYEGATLAVFAHRRIREKPPSGGVSVYRESVRADTDLVRKSEKLLDAIGWSGVAMIEFKRDAESGFPYLMEVNARLWGSLQLAVDAGVDFPRLLVEAALGTPAASPPSYREGIRSRWWWGDVDHLLARLQGAVPGDGATDRPCRLRALGDFILLWRPGDRSEVLRVDDLRPFLRETAVWMTRAMGLGDRR